MPSMSASAISSPVYQPFSPQVLSEAVDTPRSEYIFSIYSNISSSPISPAKMHVVIDPEVCSFVITHPLYTNPVSDGVQDRRLFCESVIAHVRDTVTFLDRLASEAEYLSRHKPGGHAAPIAFVISVFSILLVLVTSVANIFFSYKGEYLFAGYCFIAVLMLLLFSFTINRALHE